MSKTNKTLNPSHSSNIQRSIGKLRNAIAARLPKGTRIYFEKKSFISQAHAVMCVFDERENRVIAKYACYPSDTNPDELGSVALYCDNAAVRCLLIRRSGRLYDFPVRSASLEFGKSPFINIDLRA